jgi:hypothetical protein
LAILFGAFHNSIASRDPVYSIFIKNKKTYWHVKAIHIVEGTRNQLITLLFTQAICSGYHTQKIQLAMHLLEGTVQK